MNTTITSTHAPFELPTGRLVRAYLTEIRSEFLRLARNPGYLAPMILLPLGLYLLFAVLIWGEAIAEKPEIGTFLFTGFAVLAVTMPALFGIGPALALDRETRVVALRRAQPAPTASWLVAKLVVGVVFCALALLPMLVAAVVSGKLALAGSEIAMLAGGLLVGSLPFCALGLLVGAFLGGSAAPVWANILYLPGCYLSGLFFPLPESLHWQAPLWPQFHVSQLAMHAAGAEQYQFVPLQLSLAALIGVTVLAGAIAVWRVARRG
ncbi:MAG: ABC transporter permease [Acidobacteriota bacterium]